MAKLIILLIKAKYDFIWCAYSQFSLRQDFPKYNILLN